MPNKGGKNFTSVPGCNRLNQFSKRSSGRTATAPEASNEQPRPNLDLTVMFPPNLYRITIHDPRVFSIKDIVFTGQVNVEQKVKIGQDNWIVNLISSGEQLTVIVTPARVARSGRPTIHVALKVWSSKDATNKNEDDLRILPEEPNCTLSMRKPTGKDTILVSIGVQLVYTV